MKLNIPFESALTQFSPTHLINFFAGWNRFLFVFISDVWLFCFPRWQFCNKKSLIFVHRWDKANVFMLKIVLCFIFVREKSRNCFKSSALRIMLWKRNGTGNFRKSFLKRAVQETLTWSVDIFRHLQSTQVKGKIANESSNITSHVQEGGRKLRFQCSKSYFIETWTVENVFGMLCSFTDNKNKKSFKVVGSDLQRHFFPGFKLICYKISIDSKIIFSTKK